MFAVEVHDLRSWLRVVVVVVQRKDASAKYKGSQCRYDQGQVAIFSLIHESVATAGG